MAPKPRYRTKYCRRKGGQKRCLLRRGNNIEKNCNQKKTGGWADLSETKAKELLSPIQKIKKKWDKEEQTMSDVKNEKTKLLTEHFRGPMNRAIFFHFSAIITALTPLHEVLYSKLGGLTTLKISRS